jgi:hypothetical protein
MRTDGWRSESWGGRTDEVDEEERRSALSQVKTPQRSEREQRKKTISLLIRSLVVREEYSLLLVPSSKRETSKRGESKPRMNRTDIDIGFEMG